ncbi:MAG: hypothetical protein HY706_18675 [Candidatus Hydrogenedentes bacterium]|nr:hypothetical protein [Candidatus Hydrogenedentota bacterium]
MRRALRGAILWLVLLSPSVMAAVEEEALPDGEIMLNLEVNYGSAYRAGSWVPVDVVVINNDRDISGWAEVRCYSGSNDLQSPIYRAPAESPKGSRKRFRVYCNLANTFRIEAMLYNGNRAALDFPMRMGVTAINPKDRLALVLDEEPSDFGFLYTVIERGEDAPRFHRESLRNSELGDLAGYPQCYEQFNLIVMGDIEPERIGQTPRELLRAYVERGGILVVCTGAHALNYRGTWIEELLGVELGPEETLNEVELAAAVFAENERAEVKSHKQCTLTMLVPKNPQVQSIGQGKTIATLNPLGQGYVATIAVDATSHALQDCEGYLRLWRKLSTMRHSAAELNLNGVAQACARYLPILSGVRLYAKSSVVLYLALYLGIGVLGNWVFWNRFRRREFAWLSLVACSIGFTGYAMYFGTSGRAKATEVEQVQVLRAFSGNQSAKLDSFVGVLTTRTTRLSLDLTQGFALAKDLDLSGPTMLSGPGFYYPGNRRDFVRRPFNLVETEPARIENLTVGASDLRVVHVESEVPFAGGIEGQLVYDETGLHGDLTNRTGFNFTSAFLLFAGRLFALQPGPDGWHIDFSPGQLGSMGMEEGGYDARLMYYNSYNSPYGPGLDVGAFRSFISYSVFADANFFTGARQPLLQTQLGPFFCGWVTGASQLAATLETPAGQNIKETFFISDITVEREKETAYVWQDLRVDGKDGSRGLWCRSASTECVVQVPIQFVAPGLHALEITLRWRSEHGHTMALLPAKVRKTSPEDWKTALQGQDMVDYLGWHETTFRISDPMKYCLVDNAVIGRVGHVPLFFEVKVTEGDECPAPANNNEFTVSARAAYDPFASAHE